MVMVQEMVMFMITKKRTDAGKDHDGDDAHDDDVAGSGSDHGGDQNVPGNTPKDAWNDERHTRNKCQFEY